MSARTARKKADAAPETGDRIKLGFLENAVGFYLRTAHEAANVLAGRDPDGCLGVPIGMNDNRSGHDFLLHNCIISNNVGFGSLFER